MKTLTRPKRPQSVLKPPRARRKRFSPLMLISAGVTVLIVVAVAAYTVIGKNLGTHAAAPNTNCTLIVPNDPLSAQGLATPYQLVATDPAAGPCNEANAVQTAFVQGAVFDPATAQISIYDPLVVDQGTQPAAAPVVPTLPANATVALWFGFNGTNLTLQGQNVQGQDSSLQQGNCVNGLPGSIFGQFAYCNAPAFFAAANQAIAAGSLVTPALGVGQDGLTCMSTRDFGLVDQDQSDNVTTAYLVTANGQTAQMSAANAAQLQGATVLTNGSDNRLLSDAVDPSLGCKPWTAPNLVDNGAPEPALPLNELQAAMNQQAPIALVPPNDPMVLDGNGNINMDKMNAYRAGVDQPPTTAMQGLATQYCQDLLNVGPNRIFDDKQFTVNQASPDGGATANSLFTFLATRFNASLTNLNCNVQSPITLQTDGNGVTINATLNGQGGTTATPTPPAQGATPTPPPAATPTPPAQGATPTPPPTPAGGNTSTGGSTGSTGTGGSTGNTGGTYGTGGNTGGTTGGYYGGTTGGYPGTTGGATTPTQPGTTTVGNMTMTDQQNTSLEVVQLIYGIWMP